MRLCENGQRPQRWHAPSMKSISNKDQHICEMIAEDKEDLIDVLQVVVIQDQSFKAGQWFEELLLQGLEMIEADTQLPEI